MILAFHTEELRTICEDNTVAKAQMGGHAANVLQTRIADLRAAESIEDVLVGRPRTAGPRNSLLQLDVVGGTIMTFTPNHFRPRVSIDGEVEWARVSRVRLLRIDVPK